MERYTVFSHLSSPKAAEYRRILAMFAAARTRFVIHLRPAEVAAELGIAAEIVEPTLDQLHEWGNLDRTHDHVDAATVEEFYRVKWLYQLSSRGEAAERALETFEESLRQPGELQTEGLREIIGYLESILALLGNESTNPGSADYGKLHQQFRDLNGRFEEFTVQAQRFMRFLQSTLELHELSEDDFVAYKERLIDYLQRFVEELLTSAAEVSGLIDALEREHLHDYFPGIAERSRIDALDADDENALRRERERLAGRWDGLRRWFLGDAQQQSQAETLRARAREAIPSLLIALQGFHDRRESGSDRRRDWLQLARWFAEAPDDHAAHRLWRVAFALGPARHLRINEETLARREQSEESHRTSWLEAAPMWIEPQLRKSGRTSRSGRPPELVDLSKQRAQLRRLAAAENEQLERARERVTTRSPVFLSDFTGLDAAAFDLLMDLLGRAVSAAAHRRPSEFPVTAHSMDGSLAIELWPPRSAYETASIRCPKGTITGPDFRVAIRASAPLPPASSSGKAEHPGKASPA